jgi:predicted enzyme related to lactoylglutathione lyase
MIIPRVTRVILYVKDVLRIAAFYERHFAMHRLPGGTDKWIELAHSPEECTIALHKASVAQKSGAAIKLVFGIDDIQAFKEARERDGLKFGAIHRVDGVEFSNAKDPAGNSIQISNRGLAKSMAQASRNLG